MTALDKLNNYRAPVVPVRIGRPRRWMTDAYRADLAKRFDCAPEAVEWHLDKREEMVACIYDRTEFYGRDGI